MSKVCYAYDPDDGDVLSDVTLTVQPGERLALVGPSGAGKTTLARLLAGTDRPRAGAITVGGVPVTELALDTVQADWVRGLAEGLDTEIGAARLPVTEAQVQQLALARVILADPHTLVLDEATAQLDPRSARRAEQALAALLTGRTIITVAHRLQTARDADRVAFMSGGQIVELGSHEELLRNDGPYAALWRAWQGEAAHADGSGDASPGQDGREGPRR